jgi:hypothetical protein
MIVGALELPMVVHSTPNDEIQRRGPDRPIMVGAEATEILSPPGPPAAIFREARALVCANFLDPPLLAALLDRCRRGEFVEDRVEKLGSREVEAPQRVGAALNLILSRAPFLRWVEAVTGCGQLSRVEGRVVQTRANGCDRLDWHDDMNEEKRRLGITISLSDAPFEGGWFELRDAASERLLTRHRHQEAGTALIFAVGRGLQHRLLPIGGGGPRRVFSGWFLGG